MPKPDSLTAIREACDIDLQEEAAWAYCAQYTACPALLYAALEASRVLTKPGHIDWYTLKAKERTDIP
jgi:hypothetical protein